MKGNRTLLFVYLLCLVIVPCAQGQEFTPAEPGPAELTAAVDAQAGVLRLVRLSGTVQDALGQPRTGVLGITFALYAEQEGGAPLWLETQNVELDAEGRYAVLLGAESSEGLPLEFFSSGEARWLGVTVQGEAEQPRILLVSVPYALKAADAERLGGQLASSFVSKDPETGQLQAGGEVLESAALAGSGEETPAQVVSGTTGFLAKFTSSTDLGDSVVFESASRIGLGTTQPVAKLDVRSGSFPTVRIHEDGSNNGAEVGLRLRARSLTGAASHADIGLTATATESGSLAFRIPWNQPARMTIRSDGSVGIGTTNPAGPLHIIGGAGGGGSNSGSLILGPTLGGPHLRLGYQTGAYSWMQSHGGLPLRINPLGNHVLLNLSGGNVGIGTATPSEKLDVAGTVKATALALPNTVSAAVGVLTLGGVPFLHNFGANNTFVGAGAGNFSMTGTTNAAFGVSALSANTTGSSNAAFGQNALAANTTGGSNSGFGRNALLLNTAGNSNSAFGVSALQNNTASNNSAFGASALVSNTTGFNNSAFGSLALQSNTASDNSAFGRNALRDNTGGGSNAAFGVDALRFNITGASNSAFGVFALQNNTASNNSAFGRNTLLASTTGFQNSAFGVNALTANTTGFSNSAFGSNALVNLDGGDSNIAFGDGAGSNLTGGDNNIYIGSIGPSVPGSESGIIRIGSVATHTTTHLVGTVNAPAFVGDGSGLTGLSAAELADGSVTEAKLAFDTATQAELDAEIALRVAGDAAVQADLNTHKTSDDHTATYVNVGGDTMTGDFDLNGTLRTIKDNATSFRLRGTCDGAADDDVFDSTCQSYAGIFYNSVFNDTGGTGARTTRAIYGSNEDMDLEIQGSNHIRITAIDNNVGNGRIRLAAEDEIQFHTYPTPGGSNAETSSLDMTISDGLVTVAGSVGIGTATPADVLQVVGDIRVGASGTDGCLKNFSGGTITGSCSSDARLKKNIEPFPAVLEQVVQLRPAYFDWRVEEYPEYQFGTERSFGLIAQEVEQVLPELVSESEDGYKKVNYSKLPLLLLQAARELKAKSDSLEERLQAQQEQAALLIKAVREQQGQIQELRAELESVKARLSRSDDIQLSALKPPK